MSLQQVLVEALDGLLIQPLQDLILGYIPVAVIRNLHVSSMWRDSMIWNMYTFLDDISYIQFEHRIPPRVLRRFARLDPNPLVPPPSWGCQIDLSFFDDKYNFCDVEIDHEFGTVLNVINKE